jgi:hypothetical protein
MAKKKKIRRGSGKNKYFTKDTQAAIVEFCGSEDLKHRDKVYTERIMPAITKLAENLIFIYGFHKYGEDPNHLKQACVAALYETLHKFDASRGTNAFSYFNVVAKNWLIINSRRTKKRRDRTVCIHDAEFLKAQDKISISEHMALPCPSEVYEKGENLLIIAEMLKSIHGELENSNDLKCMNAIITVFENVDKLDFLNKRGIFVYIREISGLNSKQLSCSMTNIRRKYRAKVGADKEFDIF